VVIPGVNARARILVIRWIWGSQFFLVKRLKCRGY
jgi:hypothetical protein